MRSLLQRDEPVIRPAEMDDIAVLSEIHREAFARHWSDEEIAALLAQHAVHGLVVKGEQGWFSKTQKILGFILWRTVATEAEILTIAVIPSARGQGIGRNLMLSTLRELYSERIKEVILEVDSENKAALKLYFRLGFVQIAERPDYYTSGNHKTSALVLRYNFS